MGLQSESAMMQQSDMHTVMLPNNNSSTSCVHQLIGETIHGCRVPKATKALFCSLACAMAIRPETECLRLSLVGPVMLIERNVNEGF